MGGFMIAEVARLIKENNVILPYGLYVTNSVQEEIGLRGAQMITETIKPNLAIITDVCHDTSTPMIDPKKQGDTTIGKGPVISYAPAIQNNLREATTSVLSTLTPREERVLRMRFGIGMNTDHTLEEVGQQFSVTRERIRQIEAKGLRKLKHPSRSRKLRSFLDN